MPMDYLRRAWAEVDLDAIVHNFGVMKARLAPGCRTMAVVKADAYGHGDGPVAGALQQAGADWFAVSNYVEGVSLRAQGIVRPILILGYTPPELAGELAARALSQALVDGEHARALSAAAVAAGVTVDCHVTVDTGMTRIGFFAQQGREEQAAAEIATACALPGLSCTGIFTHFSSADETAEDAQAFTARQFDTLMGTIAALERRGVRFALRHCCNSASALCHPERGLEMARLGIVLYGLAPSADCAGMADLRPAMRLRAAVTRVQAVEPGAQVSYGRRYTAGEPRVIASLSVGYADGYRRRHADGGRVLLHGRFAPVVGTVCMDQMMVDVTGIEGVRPGDAATLAGRDGGECIPMEELAAREGSIPYETACLVGRRVPRVYIQGGRQTAAADYVLACL